MDSFFASNLKFLRKKAGLNQNEIQDRLGFKRNTWSNWENRVSVPNFSTISQIAAFFNVDVDDLFNTNLESVHLNQFDNVGEIDQNVHLKVHPSVHLKAKLPIIKAAKRPDIVSEKAPIYHTNQLPKIITVDSNNNENISYVSIKARAGYALGYGDETFIAKLPAFTLPGYNHGHYRIFEVDGHSMFPTLHSADRVITRWTGISEVRDDRVYVIVTKSDGILIKRLINRFQEGKIIAKSDNNFNGEYPSLVIDIEDISEIWYVVERWTRQLPGPGEIYKRIVNLEAELAILKDRIK